ncbi:hypothetical protein BJX65DRAFT_283643 [Aspergillus insuetus]
MHRTCRSDKVKPFVVKPLMTGSAMAATVLGAFRKVNLGVGGLVSVLLYRWMHQLPLLFVWLRGR